MIGTVSTAWVRALFVGVVLALFLGLGAGRVCAGDAPVRGPEPDWVIVAAEADAEPSATVSEGMRVLLFDTQFRADPGMESFYMRIRNKALSAQALPLLGNFAVTWSPASQDVIVHHVEIIRDGQTIDVLADQSFETLRREENLEQAMLDGRLTAILQPSGLRVGDILDVAYTLVSRDPVTAGHAEQALDLNLPLVVDRIRYRASWPADRPVRLLAADDWTPLSVQRRGGQSSVEVAMDAAQPIAVPADVPVRMRAARRIELSDYRDWADIAVLLKPLYDKARGLEAGSPLQAEIERIKALSDDPAVRAAAALRLVQDEVRYVALLMGDGALTPASADETWRRRLGDCKAKTALLLALLDGLGIEAAPAAVSIDGGDGMNERLPMIAAFNHVLVRATVGGKVYWLDGARTGDRALSGVPVPGYHWALPLTGADSALEPLVVPPATAPDTDVTITLDTTKGLYVPADITASQILRGDYASLFAGQLGLLSAKQIDETLRALWTASLSETVITQVASDYDREANVLTFTMSGTIELDWSSPGLIPPGSTFSPIQAEPRLAGEFADAPYALDHPTYSRAVTILLLPEGARGFGVTGGEVDLNELGHRTRRSVRTEANRVTIETTIQSLANEITAAEVRSTAAAEARRPWSPPRVVVPRQYQPSPADLAAWRPDESTTADEWLVRASNLSRTGDSEAAVEAASRAVEIAPERSRTWANRGVYRLQIGDRENAVADLEKAVDIDPSDHVAMNGNATLAMMDRRYDDVVIELSRALRQSPNDEFALNGRAQAYMALRQYDRALRDVDRLISVHPDEPLLELFRITILNVSGRKEEAEREIDVLAQNHPDNRVVLINQAEIKLGSGQGQAALDILDRTIPFYEDKPEQVLLKRAEAFAMLGDLDAMARDMATVRDSSADDATQLNNLCWTAAEAGVFLDQALKDCDAALAIQPSAPHFLDSRGLVRLQRGDAAGALADYEAALADQPELAPSLYGRGLARIALGQTEAGEADKAAAVEMSPLVARSFSRYRPIATVPAPAPQTP